MTPLFWLSMCSSINFDKEKWRLLNITAILSLLRDTECMRTKVLCRVSILHFHSILSLAGDALLVSPPWFFTSASPFV